MDALLFNKMMKLDAKNERRMSVVGLPFAEKQLRHVSNTSSMASIMTINESQGKLSKQSSMSLFNTNI